VLPGDILEQRADHKFYRTDLLGSQNRRVLRFVLVRFNNDGYRDLLVAIPREEPTLFEKIRGGIAQLWPCRGQTGMILGNI
jgi:hypothetical protein